MPPTPDLLGGTAQQDAAIWARFVQDYLDLLDERVAAIVVHAVADPVRARRALLSLSTTSSMVSAKSLVELLGRIRRAMDAGDRTTLLGLVDGLRDEAAAVRARFSA